MIILDTGLSILETRIDEQTIFLKSLFDNKITYIPKNLLTNYVTNIILKITPKTHN